MESAHIYSIHSGGVLDAENTRTPVGYTNYHQAAENNISLRMENTGDVTVANPRVAVNGHPRWSSIPDILAGILEHGMSEREQALAIWEFACQHRYHATTADDEVKDTVKMLNCFGYTLCWDEAFTVSNLWQAAGLRTRRGIPHGHCTTEVYFDGGWHLLDSDEHLMVLDRDNTTIVDEAAIAHDHDLLKRSHCYGIGNPESNLGSQGAAALFTHSGPRSSTARAPMHLDTTMDFDLRPGEALTWGWGNIGKFHAVPNEDLGTAAPAGQGQPPGMHGWPPPRYCNGMLEFTPRLDEGFEQWVEAAHNIHLRGDGSPGLQASHILHAGPASVSWRLTTKYPIVGAHVITTTIISPDKVLPPNATAGPLRPVVVSVQRQDDEQHGWLAAAGVVAPSSLPPDVQQQTASGGPDTAEMKLAFDLDPAFVPGSRACYGCVVQIEFCTSESQPRQQQLSDEGATSRTAYSSTLSHVKIALDLQMAPLALPGLRCGSTNIIEYSDAGVIVASGLSTEEQTTVRDHLRKSVELTHTWVEIDGPAAPPPPTLLQPLGAVAGTQLIFRWCQPNETADEVVDFHLRVGADRELKHALSPVFEKLHSNCAPLSPAIATTLATNERAWIIPEIGLLNPGTEYYWAVRCRNAAGNWGVWSAATAFTPQAPAVPTGLQILADYEERTLTLQWSPSPTVVAAVAGGGRGGGTTQPVAYEVYGSSEKGFTASRTAHTVLVGGDCATAYALGYSVETGQAEFPSNLLCTIDITTSTMHTCTQHHSCIVVSDGGDDDSGFGGGGGGDNDAVGGHHQKRDDKHCFFRVVAVDAKGVRSGPSTYAAAPRPFIYSTPPTAIVAGRATHHRVRSLCSIGELQAQSGAQGVGRYESTFRGGDELRFLLDEGPAFIRLDEVSGKMVLAPEARDVGTHTVTVRVLNHGPGTAAANAGLVGSAILGFDCTVLPVGVEPPTSKQQLDQAAAAVEVASL
eukprot:SAG31_NODE_3322_length_4412_cov_3.107814_1_plen_970_part_00